MKSWSRGGVPGETRTRDLLGHTPDGMKPDLSNKSAKEIARWLVGWMEREGFGTAYGRKKFRETIEALPDGSLSLAASRGVLFEKAARGVRKDGKGGAFING